VAKVRTKPSSIDKGIKVLFTVTDRPAVVSVSLPVSVVVPSLLYKTTTLSSLAFFLYNTMHQLWANLKSNLTAKSQIFKRKD